MITSSRKYFITLTLFTTLAFWTASLHAQWMMTAGWDSKDGHVPVPASFAVDGDTILASGDYSFYYNSYPEMSGLLFSSDLGSSWKRIGFYNQRINIQAALGPSLLIFEYDSLIYSSDFGQHWAPPSGLPYMKGYSGPTQIGVHNIVRLDNQLFLLADSGYDYLRLYRSANKGQTWQRIELNGLVPYPYSSTSVRVFALSGHRLLVSLIDSIAHFGFPSEHSVIHFFSSSDEGLNWTRKPGHILSENINSLAEIGNHIFVTSDSGLFHSTDGGGTWNSILHGFVSSLLAVDNSLFIGVRGGVLYSNDLGNHWWDSDWGFDSIDHYRDIKTVGLAVCGQTLFATPSSDPPTQNAGGVWRRALADFGISASVSIPKNKAEVLTAYPNPLSQSTTISFTPEANGYADISIVNQLGVEVARIFSGELNASEHTYMWSKPTGLPDGVYECLIRMNGKTEHLPLVLQR